MEEEGGTWVFKESNHLGVKLIAETADGMMKHHGWYAVGVKLEGSEKWSYINYCGSNIESSKTGKVKRKPKYSKVSLPMRDNPIKAQNEEFERFWQAYPNTYPGRRVNKKGALRKWKVMKLEQKAKLVISNLEQWKKTDQWQSEGGKFIPMICTWMNRQPWEDADPAFEKEDMKRHQNALEEEREIAKNNPVKPQLAGVEDGEIEEAEKLWNSMSAMECYRIEKKWIKEKGYAPMTMIKLWQYRSQQ